VVCLQLYQYSVDVVCFLHHDTVFLLKSCCKRALKWWLLQWQLLFLNWTSGAFLKHYVHYCPKEMYETAVVPLLAQFCPVLHQVIGHWFIIATGDVKGSSNIQRFSFQLGIQLKFHQLETLFSCEWWGRPAGDIELWWCNISLHRYHQHSRT